MTFISEGHRQRSLKCLKHLLRLSKSVLTKKLSKIEMSDYNNRVFILCNVLFTAFISHSSSLVQLRFVFQAALPSIVTNLADKLLVDVGSRLGAVLYGASIFRWFFLLEKYCN